ncbi:hypothetical protein [Clostridium algidicarnis]|nr:hypothetical protein [Clostridium algidicarnis]
MFKFKDFDYLTDGEIDLKIEEKYQQLGKNNNIMRFIYEEN